MDNQISIRTEAELLEQGFFNVCKISGLKERQGKRFIVNETEIALFKVDGTVYALNNICPHQHSAILFDGFVEEGCVVCPAHGWEFNLRDGKRPNGFKGVDTYEVTLLNEDVFVKVIPKKLNW